MGRKQKKKRTKKYSKLKKYTTGGRVDMSTGGRVSKQVGGLPRPPVVDPETGQAVQNQQVGEATIPSATPEPAASPQQPFVPSQEELQRIGREAANRVRGNPFQQAYNRGREFDERARGERDLEPGGRGFTGSLIEGSQTPPLAPTPSPRQVFETERRDRMVEAGREAEAIARGEIPEGAIPKAEIVPVPTGPDYESEAIQLAQRKGVTPEFIQQVGTERVQQMEDVTTVATPEQLQAAQMEAAQITDTPDVDVAVGQVDDRALAQAAGVQRVAPIEGAEVEIIPGALTERVVGSLSSGAIAQAAQVAGTSLSRITRAKKQLRNAGLSEDDITQLGNDPEALEDRLADFSETERGIIAGLPQEALVSNQLNSLLAGIEEGEIPTWARPAVASVESMLARRGMSASTVGRDALLNAIIQSAIPVAQSNAQAIQQSVSQQRNIEAQVEITNAQFRQQTALQNAKNVFSLDVAQFSADQQTALSNSKFLQTVGISEATMDQQSIIQNAVLMSQANLAEADFFQKAQIQNAQAFLQMDLTNLNNQQQSNILRAQQQQQVLLSNQSAENAARQFNAVSQNQTQQFMASLSTQVNQFNAQQENAAKQFNVQQQNAAEARRVQNQLEINKANAAIVNQTKQFNEQIDFNRTQFNAQNAQAIEQSNVEWRRRANLADTVAQNEANRLNVQQAFNLSSQAQAFLWQELRDQADYDFKWAVSTADRKANAMIAAASTEGEVAKNWSTMFDQVSGTIDRMFGPTGGGS